VNTPFPTASNHAQGTPERCVRGRERGLRNAAFFGIREVIERVYGQGRREKVATLTNLYPDIVDLANFHTHTDRLREVEVIFSTWGMPPLQTTHLDRLPSLRAVFFAGGTVQPFARPFLDRGIIVVSAWRVNAIPVAEFTLAQILLATKGYFRNAREFRSPAAYKTAFRGSGNFGETIAILGAGAVGQKVIEFLKPFQLHVIVFDSFLTDAQAAELGVEKVTLEAAFRRGYVLSNHLADVPKTKQMLHGELFAAMRENATFINTGRGATVDEAGMIRVLKSRPDLTALLDVTWPEPPSEGSPLYTLPNVALSTHFAGSSGDEVVRMADCCLEEFISWQADLPLNHTVSASMLETMTRVTV
jgi:phosphoglycerate dehydrogenase-like enzyme